MGVCLAREYAGLESEFWFLLTTMSSALTALNILLPSVDVLLCWEGFTRLLLSSEARFSYCCGRCTKIYWSPEMVRWSIMLAPCKLRRYFTNWWSSTSQLLLPPRTESLLRGWKGF